MPLNTDKDFRTIMSVGPSFIKGHQIMKIRRRARRAPQWAYDDEKIKKLLVTSFPKLATDDVQRKRAGRWAQVIQLYFRMKRSQRETAEETGQSIRDIHDILVRIRRAASGKPVDGRKRKNKKHAPL